MKTAEKKFLGLVILISVILLVIASFGDFQISKGLMNQNSIFGTLFQIFGSFPAKFVPFIAGGIIFMFGLKQGKAGLKWLIALAGLAFALWWSWIWVNDWMHYLVETLNNLKHHAAMGAADNSIGATADYSRGLAFLIALIAWGIGIGLVYLWLKKKTLETLSKLLIVAIAGVVITNVTGSIVNTMKGTWGRFRPYEITEFVSSAKGTFTSWWHINGNNGHQSFPSGHTNSAVAALIFPFFAERKNIKMQKILAYGGLIFTLLMMFSRVRVGAHFLSDTTVSLVIGAFVTYLVMKCLNYSFIEDELN